MNIVERLTDINLRTEKASSDFSSFWGQQNNPDIRSLRLREKNIVSDLLASSVKTEFNFYRHLDPNSEKSLSKDG